MHSGQDVDSVSEWLEGTLPPVSGAASSVSCALSVVPDSHYDQSEPPDQLSPQNQATIYRDSHREMAKVNLAEQWQRSISGLYNDFR